MSIFITKPKFPLLMSKLEVKQWGELVPRSLTYSTWRPSPSKGIKRQKRNPRRMMVNIIHSILCVHGEAPTVRESLPTHAFEPFMRETVSLNVPGTETSNKLWQIPLHNTRNVLLLVLVVLAKVTAGYLARTRIFAQLLLTREKEEKEKLSNSGIWC